jgi:hypothetical protein
MDFWKLQPREDDEEYGQRQPEPSFFEKLTEFAKDEVMAEAVEHLSGGWITLEDDGDEEERPRRDAGQQDSFEERLQRELAKLTPQTAEVQEAGAEPATLEAPQPLPSAPPEYIPVARPAAVRAPQGFGRKLV